MAHRLIATDRMAPTSPARHASTKTQKDTLRQIISAITGTHNTDGISTYLAQLNPKAYAPRQTISVPTGARRVDPVRQFLAELPPQAKAFISQRAVDIKMKHPDWSQEKIYEEAKRLLPSFYRSPKSVPT